MKPAPAENPTTPIPESKFWTKPEVLAFCRFSDSTLSRLERTGHFPKRLVLARRKVLWSRLAVERWAADLSSDTQKAG